MNKRKVKAAKQSGNFSQSEIRKAVKKIKLKRKKHGN